MKAVAFRALHAPLQLVELPDPTPTPGGVVVKVHRCGICGSDLHMAEDHAYGAQPGDVFGHEFSGEVVAVGPQVERLRLGDPVSIIPYRSCGRCAECLDGNPAWCAQMKLQGGGYAEYVAVGERQCVPLPRTASLADGALIEPLAVALHGVNVAAIRPGDKVLVLGAGPIGLSVAFWARRAGAARVVVQDISPAQRERALQMGATDFVVDIDEPVAGAQRALGGLADVCCECVGLPGLIMQSVQSTRIRGRILLLGLCRSPDPVVPFAILRKELTIVSSVFFHRREYEAALDALLRGAPEPRALVTDTVGLANTPAIFEALKRRSGQCKVLIDPAAA